MHLQVRYNWDGQCTYAASCNSCPIICFLADQTMYIKIIKQQNKISNSTEKDTGTLVGNTEPSCGGESKLGPMQHLFHPTPPIQHENIFQIINKKSILQYKKRIKYIKMEKH